MLPHELQANKIKLLSRYCHRLFSAIVINTINCSNAITIAALKKNYHTLVTKLNKEDCSLICVRTKKLGKLKDTPLLQYLNT